MAKNDAEVHIRFVADLVELHATRDAIRETSREIEMLSARMAQARAEIEALEMKLAVDEVLGPETPQHRSRSGSVEPDLYAKYDAELKED